MRELLTQIDEALLGFKGATRDRRQQLGTPSAGPLEYSLFDQLTADYNPDAKIQPGGWEVQIAYGESDSGPAPRAVNAAERGTSTKYLSGPVTVRLIGHTALSDEEFNHLMDTLWTAHCRQVVLPDHYNKQQDSGAKSGYSGAESTKEVRNLCRNGRYGRAWRHKFPKAQDKFDELVSLLDDLCHFPEMGAVFRQPRFINIDQALMMLRQYLEDFTTSGSGRRSHQSKANTPTTPPPGDFSLI
jgi:hypothetical protein